MDRVSVKPQMLQWARERAGVGVDALLHRFPKLLEWEHGELKPTLKQLESFAKATHAPIGYFFLSKPPVEQIPIPDFRTINNQQVTQASPNLLDTLYLCQQRQAWYKDYMRNNHEDSLAFIGSANINDPIEQTAEKIRHQLGFDLEVRRAFSTWTDVLRHFISQADDMGVMVMCSGVVLNNNKRRLDPQEFRGFAMVDQQAPLVFINGSDSKAAQMFTLAHELAHLWLGESALSNADAMYLPEHKIERWCNQVAAELLVPIRVLRQEYDSGNALSDEATRLARRFKVSTLVIMRRIYDAGFISQGEFKKAYDQELQRLLAISKGSGGNFYLTQTARVSKRFARALIESTLEGQTLYRDAFKMLGVKKQETFNELGRNLGYFL